MAIFNRFEEITTWQRDRELCKCIKSLTDKQEFSRDFKLIDQIKGSSGSVMDNIAERFERGGSKEFIQFLYISKGSAGETRSQLYRALDNEYISEKEFNKAYEMALETGKLVGGLISHLKASDLKGEKYK